MSVRLLTCDDDLAMVRIQTFTKILLACGVLVLASPLLPTGAAASTESDVAFGAHVAARGNQTDDAAVHDLEQSIGRRLAIVRIFYRWDSSFPTVYEKRLRAGGRTLMMSVVARRQDGTVVP